MISPNAFSSHSVHPLHIIKTLGEGTHGKVFLALDTVTGAEVRTIKWFAVVVMNKKLQFESNSSISCSSSLHVLALVRVCKPWLYFYVAAINTCCLIDTSHNMQLNAILNWWVYSLPGLQIEGVMA